MTLSLISDDCIHHYIDLAIDCIYYVPFNTADIHYIEGCLMMSASLSTSKRQSFSSE